MKKVKPISVKKKETGTTWEDVFYVRSVPTAVKEKFDKLAKRANMKRAAFLEELISKIKIEE
jgi:hypothetical protein